MNIVEVGIKEIKPYWRNARNNQKTIEALKKSITDYGFNVPIIVDSNMVIIAGHARFNALKQLKYDKVQVVISDLSEDKAKEYRIVDNKTHELTTWDMNDLKIELREISNNDDMSIYFDFDVSNMLEVNNISTSNSYDFTQDQIDSKSDKMDDKFKDIANKRNNDQSQIEVICPHCLEGFNVKVSG